MKVLVILPREEGALRRTVLKLLGVDSSMLDNTDLIKKCIKEGYLDIKVEGGA